MDEAARLARAHYRQQQALARTSAEAVIALWALVDLVDLDGSWAALADRASQLLALGQYRSALAAARYLTAQAEAQGVADLIEGLVDPRAFTGVAADGRALAPLLLSGVIEVKSSIGAGFTPVESKQRGLARLLTIVANEVVQAGINATFTGITANLGYEAHVRVLTPPSCGRCAILAGRIYQWSDGFARHPHCDCQMLPVSQALDAQQVVKDPRAYFDSLDAAGQRKFAGSEAGAQAIRDGADPAQVVNVYAKRNRRTSVNGSTLAPNSGLRTFDVLGTRLQYTNEGANVLRGRYGRAVAERTGQTDQRLRRENGRYPKPDQFELADVKRLTPRSIYQLANGDRARAIDLLRQYGYIT